MEPASVMVRPNVFVFAFTFITLLRFTGFAGAAPPITEPESETPGDSWIEKSNKLAQPALELIAKFHPESAGRYGVDGFHSSILDLKENVYQRNRDETLAVVELLKRQRSVESHPKVRQDLELLIQTLTDRVERNARSFDLMLPYVNVAEIVFESMRGILNSNVDPELHFSAVKRLKKYAGVGNDHQPISQLARDRITERFGVQGLLGPYRGKINKDIANSQRFVDGIASLMQKHEMEGWQLAHKEFEKQIQSYNEWLQTELLPRARGDHRLPPELYVDQLRSFGVRMAPNELIERAQFGYAEIRNEMESVARQIAKKRNWKQNDYRHVIAQLKQEQLAVDEILPTYEQRLKDVEEIIRREGIVSLPKRKCRIRFATAAESARIPAPSVQPPRLIGNTGEFGTFLIPLNNPNAKTDAKMDDFLHRSITWSLTAHEARPGHEMQFSAIVENGVSIPRAVFAWNSANVEGWGLYAESIMKEHLPTEGQFFTLYMRLLRAARAFLDPMLNLGQLRPHQAKAFLMRELLLSEPMAEQEVDRYTSWMPGQATSYYYGLMKLQAIRTQTEIILGDRFDQLHFNDFVLWQGLLPPELLKKAVLEEFVPSVRANNVESAVAP